MFRNRELRGNMQSNENGNTNLFTSTLLVKKGIFTPLWGELFTFSHLQTYSFAYSGSQPISLALEQQGWHWNVFSLSAVTWTIRYSYRKSHSRHTPRTKCPLRKRVRTHQPSNPFKTLKLKYDPCIFQYHGTQYLGGPGLKGIPTPHHPARRQGSPRSAHSSRRHVSPLGPSARTTNAARAVSSSPQPCPTWPQAPPSRAHPQTHIPAHPQPIPILREVLNGAEAAPVPPAALLLTALSHPHREVLLLWTPWQGVHSNFGSLYVNRQFVGTKILCVHFWVRK